MFPPITWVSIGIFKGCFTYLRTTCSIIGCQVIITGATGVVSIVGRSGGAQQSIIGRLLCLFLTILSVPVYGTMLVILTVCIVSNYSNHNKSILSYNRNRCSKKLTHYKQGSINKDLLVRYVLIYHYYYTHNQLYIS